MKRYTAALTIPMLAVHALADDAAIEHVGGTIRAMHEHPTIAMVAEYVHAELHVDSVRVECVFYLKNAGPATRVTIGFPEMATGGIDRPSHFTEFRSWVDGDEIRIEPIDAPAEIPEGEHMTWWVKEVSFEKGATRVIRDRYVAPPGGMSDGTHWFQYILYTGASWAGSIGVADIVVDLEAGAELLPLVGPSPPRRSGNELSWHFQQFEPAGRYSAVTLYWRSGQTGAAQR